MSGTQHATARHSPPHMKKTSGLKAARSAPSSRNLAAGPRITIKGATKAKHAKEREESFDFEGDESDTMAMSFLQYCAMCEKQIIVPNTSILYCSESCRRRDAALPDTVKSTVRLADTSDNKNDRDFLDDFFSNSLPDPLPRLQPTPRTGFKDARIPPTFHQGASDLDPTEWKPSEKAPSINDGKEKQKEKEHPTASLPTISGRASPAGSSCTSLTSSWKPKLPHRPSSEAFTYLSQFHRSSDSLSSSSRRAARPTTTGTNSFAAPSLSHSPGISSTATSSSEASLSGTPYDFELVTRPSVVSLPSAAVVTTAATPPPSAGGAKEIGEEEGAMAGMGMGIGVRKEVVPAGANGGAGEVGLKSAQGSLKKLLAGAGKM